MKNDLLNLFSEDRATELMRYISVRHGFEYLSGKDVMWPWLCKDGRVVAYHGFLDYPWVCWTRGGDVECIEVKNIVAFLSGETNVSVSK